MEKKTTDLIKTVGLSSLYDDIKTGLCNATVRKDKEPRLTKVPKSTSGAPS
jgi:hypothetical protein